MNFFQCYINTLNFLPIFIIWYFLKVIDKVLVLFEFFMLHKSKSDFLYNYPLKLLDESYYCNDLIFSLFNTRVNYFLDYNTFVYQTLQRCFSVCVCPSLSCSLCVCVCVCVSLSLSLSLVHCVCVSLSLSLSLFCSLCVSLSFVHSVCVCVCPSSKEKLYCVVGNHEKCMKYWI